MASLCVRVCVNAVCSFFFTIPNSFAFNFFEFFFYSHDCYAVVVVVVVLVRAYFVITMFGINFTLSHKISVQIAFYVVNIIIIISLIFSCASSTKVYLSTIHGDCCTRDHSHHSNMNDHLALPFASVLHNSVFFFALLLLPSLLLPALSSHHFFLFDHTIVFPNIFAIFGLLNG